MNQSYTYKNNGAVIIAILLLTCMASSVAAIGTKLPVVSDMVLYYQFTQNVSVGENSTLVYDWSGNNNNGTVSGSNPFNSTGGYFGDGGINFNNSQFITVNNNPSLVFNGSTNFTVQFWIKVASTPATKQYIIAKVGSGTTTEWDISMETTGSIGSRNGLTSGGPISSNITDNSWHLMTLTYERGVANGAKIYKDGVLDATGSLNTTAILNNTQALLIGKRNSGNAFSGSLDETIIYNRTLSSTDVWNNYQTYYGCFNLTSSQILRIGGNISFCNQINQVTTSTYLVNITNSNVDLNCGGKSFVGNTSGTLFFTQGYDNISISNCNITNYQNAVYIKNFNNVTFRYNTVINSSAVIANGNFNGMYFLDNNITGYNTVDAFLVWLQASYSQKWNVNISGNNFTNTPYRAIFLSYGNYTNLHVSNNRFYNASVDSTNGGEFININGADGYGTIERNVLNLTSVGLLFSGSQSAQNYSMNTIVQHNIVDDLSMNGDSYNVGFHVNTANNITFTNNTVTRVGCVAFLLQGANNVRIINNTASFDLQSNIDKKSNCAYEPIAFISATGLWKTWTSNSPRSPSNITAAYLNSAYTANNLFISGNTVNHFPLFLKISSYNNLSIDLLTFTSYLFSSDTYLEPYTKYYFTGSNLSTTYGTSYGANVSVSYLLGQGSGNSLSNLVREFIVSSQFVYLKNTNGTFSNQSTFLNLSDALIYFNNGSVQCTNIPECDGNITYILSPNNYSYVINNYSVNQSALVRPYDPISVSNSSSNVRTLTSTLTSTLTNVSVTLQTGGITPSTPRVTYPNGSSEYPSYLYDSVGGTITFDATIPPGVSTVTLNDGAASQASICSDGVGGLGELSSWLPLIALVIAAGVVVGAIKVFQSGVLPSLGLDDLGSVALLLVGGAITISVGLQIVVSAIC